MIKMLNNLGEYDNKVEITLYVYKKGLKTYAYLPQNN
jgi:hypothetical protein